MKNKQLLHSTINWAVCYCWLLIICNFLVQLLVDRGNGFLESSWNWSLWGTCKVIMSYLIVLQDTYVKLTETCPYFSFALACYLVFLFFLSTCHVGSSKNNSLWLRCNQIAEPSYKQFNWVIFVTILIKYLL